MAACPKLGLRSACRKKASSSNVEEVLSHGTWKANSSTVESPKWRRHVFSEIHSVPSGGGGWTGYRVCLSRQFSLWHRRRHHRPS